MHCKFEALSVISVVPKPDGNGSTLEGVQFSLEMSGELERRAYLDNEDQSTKLGVHAITSCFVHGLAANIHYAHQSGMRDSAEHLRYVIAELERAFVQNVEIEKGTFQPLHNIPDNGNND